MTRRCDGCVHYHPEVTTGQATYRGGAGECRAKTPGVFQFEYANGSGDAAYRMWPIVWPGDWCGEFQPASERERAR